MSRSLRKYMSLLLAMVMVFGSVIRVSAGMPVDMSSNELTSKTTFSDAAYLFDEAYKGTGGIVEVLYDLTVNANHVDGVISFQNAAYDTTSFQTLQAPFRIKQDQGPDAAIPGQYFDAYDGKSGYVTPENVVNWEAGATYSVKQVYNFNNNTFSVWVDDVLINEDLTARVGKLEDIGQVVMIAQTGEMAATDTYNITNLTINGKTPAVETKSNKHTEPMTLTVGKGGKPNGFDYATLTAALFDAIPGDVIEINGGTYVNLEAVASIAVPNITIIGINDADGNKPRMIAESTYQVPNNKGLWVIEAKGVTIENIRFEGATSVGAVGGNNVSNVRYEPGAANDAWLIDCDFIGGNNGVHTSHKGSGADPSDPHDLHMLRCNFYKNGVNGTGLTHNMYIGNIDEFYFIDSISQRSHNSGHIMKTRAANNFVVNSVLMEGSNVDTWSNSLIDVSEAGNLYVIGSVFQEAKESSPGNNRLISYGQESRVPEYNGGNPGRDVVFMYNTIVKQTDNTSSAFRFFNPGDENNTTFTTEVNEFFMNNVFVDYNGSTALLDHNGNDVTEDWFKEEDGNFIFRDEADALDLFDNPDSFNFRLKEDSALIGAAVAVNEASILAALENDLSEKSISLVPGKMPIYANWALEDVIDRETTNDVGAYEYYDYDRSLVPGEGATPPVIDDEGVSLPGFKSSPDWGKDAALELGAVYTEGTVYVEFDMKHNAMPTGDAGFAPANTTGEYIQGNTFANSFYRIFNAGNTTNFKISTIDGNQNFAPGFDYSVGSTYHYQVVFTIGGGANGKGLYSVYVTDADGNEVSKVENKEPRQDINRTPISTISAMMFNTPNEGDYEVFNVYSGTTAYTVGDAVLYPDKEEAEVPEPGIASQPVWADSIVDLGAVYEGGKVFIEYDIKHNAVPTSDSVIAAVDTTQDWNTPNSVANAGMRLFANNEATIKIQNGNGAANMQPYFSYQLGETYHHRLEYDLDAKTYSLFITDADGDVVSKFENAIPREGRQVAETISAIAFCTPNVNAYEIFNLTSGRIGEAPTEPEVPEGTPIISGPGLEPNTKFEAPQIQKLDAPISGTVNIEFDLVPQTADIGESAIMLTTADGRNDGDYTKRGYRVHLDGLNVKVSKDADGILDGDAYNSTWIAASDTNLTLVVGKTYHFQIIADLDAKLYSVYVTDSEGNVFEIAKDYVPRDRELPATLQGVAFYSSTEGAYHAYNLVMEKYEDSGEVELLDEFESRVESGNAGNDARFNEEAIYKLDKQYNGPVNVEFDLVLNNDITDITKVAIGLTTPNAGKNDYSATHYGYRAAIETSGRVVVANANGVGEDNYSWAATNNVTLVKGEVYHFQMVANLMDASYSLYVTGPDGVKVAVAEDCIPRSRFMPSTVGGVAFFSSADGDYTVYNLKVNTVDGNGGGDEPIVGRTLTVGTGGQYATILAAYEAATTGDTILINANDTYKNETALLRIRKSGLTFRGVDGFGSFQPASLGVAPDGVGLLTSKDKLATMVVDPDVIESQMGIWVLNDGINNITIENIAFYGAHDVGANQGANFAGIRLQSTNNVLLKNCYFEGNDNGILTGGGSKLVVENCEFYRNGHGDGQSHNLYISGNTNEFYFINSYSHQSFARCEVVGIATNQGAGHLLKSRALNTYIINSWLTEEDADSNYNSNSNVDISQGGNLTIVGSVLQQSATPDGGGWSNYKMISYGIEGNNGASNNKVVMINNTFVNDMWNAGEAYWGPMFFAGGHYAAGSIDFTVQNNIYAGISPAISFSNVDYTDEYFATADGNFYGDPNFVNRAGYDYTIDGNDTTLDAISVAVAPFAVGDQTYTAPAGIVGGVVYAGLTVNKDMTALDAVVAMVEALDENAYTIESWAVLAEAVAAAKLLTSSDEQSAVNRAEAAILLAVSGLAFKPAEVNKGVLEALLDQVLLLEEADYTPATWAGFAVALADAVAVFENGAAAQGAVDAAVEALSAAHTGLVAPGNKAGLLTLLEGANGMNNPSVYTAESLAALVSAIDAAQVVAEDVNATQADVDGVVSALELAISGLVALEAPAQVDKSVLAGLVADFEANKVIYATAFSAESLAVLGSAVAAGDALVTNDNATKDEVDGAIDAILAAIAGLEDIEGSNEVMLPADVLAYYKKLAAMNSAGYTNASWANFDAARQAFFNYCDRYLNGEYAKLEGLALAVRDAQRGEAALVHVMLDVYVIKASVVGNGDKTIVNEDPTAGFVEFSVLSSAVEVPVTSLEFVVNTSNIGTRSLIVPDGFSYRIMSETVVYGNPQYVIQIYRTDKEPFMLNEGDEIMKVRIDLPGNAKSESAMVYITGIVGAYDAGNGVSYDLVASMTSDFLATSTVNRRSLYDVNNDGSVTYADYDMVRRHMGKTNQDGDDVWTAEVSRCDVNFIEVGVYGDGVIDWEDATAVYAKIK